MKIIVIPGDGIGPETMATATEALEIVSEKFDPLNDDENSKYRYLIEELLVCEEREEEDEDGDNTGDEQDRVQ